VLRDVSVRIEPGQKVGIVGPSGSGKSTLLGVLRGDVTPESGQLELHGIPLLGRSPIELRKAVSEAQQSALMFNRTVRENVAFGGNDVDADQIAQALIAAEARKLVEELPLGLDTLVGERGAALSTGERQRLSIARALLRTSPLLVFDEATSSVDAISEARILDHLVHEQPTQTVVVVSHRVATLSRFDLILVMDQGRIVDTGSPDELRKRCGLYQRLLQHEPDADATSLADRLPPRGVNA
jgi:ATP-binding cassette subfamily B protein